jgi:hypothetical protein
MIAFPIPGTESVPPIVGILVMLAATAGLVVLVVQAVRYFRRSGDSGDVFGPDVPRDPPPTDDKDEPNR